MINRFQKPRVKRPQALKRDLPKTQFPGHPMLMQRVKRNKWPTPKLLSLFCTFIHPFSNVHSKSNIIINNNYKLLLGKKYRFYFYPG